MSKDRIDGVIDELLKEFKQTQNPESLEKLYSFVDQQVYDEKQKYHLRHMALHRLEELEKSLALSNLLLYRKAVLCLLVQRKEEAESLFRKLIEDDEVEDYLQDRSRGYLLKYFDESVTQKEAVTILERLKVSTDATALHMLEEIHVKFDLHSQVEEEVVDPMYVFTSDFRYDRKCTTNGALLQLRIEHIPEKYDIYLDFLHENYCLTGTKVDLNMKELATLFTMTTMGLQCQNENLFYAIYRERLEDNNKKQINKLHQFLSRLRQKLAPYHITFQRTSLPAYTTFFLLFREADRQSFIFED